LPGKPATRILQLALPETLQDAFAHPESRPIAVGQLLLYEPLWTCNGFAPVTYLIMPPWLRTRVG
jgi:hypothetical protein